MSDDGPWESALSEAREVKRWIERRNIRHEALREAQAKLEHHQVRLRAYGEDMSRSAWRAVQDVNQS